MRYNKSRKSRRKFLRSTGIMLTGIGLMKPAFLIGVGRGKLANPIQPPDLKIDTIPLPDEVKAVWDIAKAFRLTTPSRERICINGLWLWQPGDQSLDKPPSESWGYFKVPGNWPGFSDYMQAESQKLYSHPAWKDKLNPQLITAWYQREITIPEDWEDRKVTLSVEYLNSLAEVFIDDVKAGEIVFPAGELDITRIVKPGGKYFLSIKVTALPLQDVVAVFNDSNAPRTGKGTVQRKGLCGDIYLNSAPLSARITNVKIDTSVRREEINLTVLLADTLKNKSFTIHANISDNGQTVKEITSKAFSPDDLSDGVMVITEKWKPEKLWDTHTPQNKYEIILYLKDEKQKVIDTYFPVKFGFRELWIDGRDFYLNGSRIFLSTVPLDNAQGGATLANYEAAKESMLRLQGFGINFVYTHNYGCEPGTHLSFEEVLRAADDTGMLVSFSQPHFGQYIWDDPDADNNNGYARHASFYVRAAQNHPSVVFYSMNHNATGYADDMNPDLIDGYSDPRNQAAKRSAERAQRVEKIVQKIDPHKIIYHHSSGNLSSLHTSNFYPNWVPIQEMCDWFEHWSTKGVKPLFTCEFGSPFTWDWVIYRGWYKGKREFGGAIVPWEFCLAEWNAQFLGDQAYRISEMEKENLRWEAGKFRAGEVWGRNQYPYNLDNRILEERNPVFAMHIAEQWRAFRTWEISANSPWHFAPYWKLRQDVDKSPKEIQVDWENLQKPGLSPDVITNRRERVDLGYERSDWINTVASEALINNNKPLLAYIGGKPSTFTSKDHNYLPGETVEKQVIIINNSRQDVDIESKWSVNLPGNVPGINTLTLKTGQQERIPIRISLPENLTPGKYEINSAVSFSNGEIQEDSFTIHVLHRPRIIKPAESIALWDPVGETGRLLDSLDIDYQTVDAGADLELFNILIIGKAALTVDGPGLDLARVRNGLKVIVFEQIPEVLERRMGFRIQQYGLRNVYRRVPNHPVLSGLNEENLSYWRGDATIIPPRLNLEMSEKYRSPSTKWCDIEVTRIWRCGNRGSVASVLIEKPAAGNFLPLIDGGYSLQYSPLMEYREGSGVVLFCQMDVTGRTESEPAAEILARNMISYVSYWEPRESRRAYYAGSEAGKAHLERSSVTLENYEGGNLRPMDILIVDPEGSGKLTVNQKSISKWLRKGGCMLTIGLNKEDFGELLPDLEMKKEEHISAFFESQGTSSLLTGIGPADIHNRAPLEVSKVTSGAAVFGDGVLAVTENNQAVLCQLVPWQLDYSREQHNVKQTFRRTSFLVNRLMGNLDVPCSTKVLDRFNSPADPVNDKRWLEGLYLDEPEEWDDPYRFFRW